MTNARKISLNTGDQDRRKILLFYDYGKNEVFHLFTFLTCLDKVIDIDYLEVRIYYFVSQLKKKLLIK